MNSVYYAKMGQGGTGLTNQLFALITSILVCRMKNKSVLICCDFRDDFSNNKSTPISHVFNMNQFNLFLRRYNITLFDSKYIDFKITNAVYGNNYNLIDVTNEVINKFYDVSTQCMYIPCATNLNSIKGDPIYGKKKELYIQYTINNQPFTEVVCEGFSNNIVFDLKTATYSHDFAWIHSIDRRLFDEILRNIPFHDRFVDIPNIQELAKRVNVLHLRLEDDAINHWAGVNKMEVCKFQSAIEEKYISIITQCINKSDMNIILSGSTTNEVINFMVNNGYNVTIPMKHFTDARELNAIVDFLMSKNCNNVFVGNFNMKSLSGSTFSYLISIHLNSEIKQVYIDLDRINDPPTIFYNLKSV